MKRDRPRYYEVRSQRNNAVASSTRNPISYYKENAELELSRARAELDWNFSIGCNVVHE